MLHFELEISPHTTEDDIDGLARGHLTITGSQGTATSKGQQPDQSMMIFLSIVELLDGLRRFLLDRHASRYHFVGVDSSFQFLVTREADDAIRVMYDQNTLEVVRTEDMIAAVWAGIDRFMSRYGRYIVADDPVADDLHSSLESFARSFNIRHQ
jgi:hypothetical protein